MTALRSDLVIVDEVVESYEDKIKTSCEKLNSYFNRYINIMESVYQNAIVSGETSAAIEEFVNLASQVKGKFRDVGSCSRSTLMCFLDDVDEADKYLY